MGTPMTNHKDQQPLAFLFPGQGSQFVGMGKDLFESSKAARTVFEEVDDALGVNLTKLILEGPEDSLKETINSQPAIMAVSLACVKAMEETIEAGARPKPSFLAGHSLGEYTALAVAGVLDVADTARLVRERGRLMNQACKRVPGGMAAIFGFDEITMEEICNETGTYISNINSDTQIVISGERKALAMALDLASARGARKVIPLKVSGAFHSGLMEPAKKGLIKAMSGMKFREPNVPIVANVTGKALTSSDAIKQELAEQISGCVRWKTAVDFMSSAGVTDFIELGPGRVLSGLVKTINRNANVSSIGDLAAIRSLLN